MWGVQLLKNFCVLVVVSCFLNFFVFLKVLHCCLCIWKSGHFLRLDWLTLGEKCCHQSAQLGIRRFRPFLWLWPLHTPCALLEGNFFLSIYLLIYLKHLFIWLHIYLFGLSYGTWTFNFHSVTRDFCYSAWNL